MREYFKKIGLAQLLFPFMLLIVLLASLHPIPTADLWMFLSLGRHIITEGSFPSGNIFSYTAPDFPVIDHEWIPEIVFYALHKLFGFNALYFLKIIMIVGAFLILILCARKRGVEPLFCIVAVMLSAPVAKGNLYFDIRPYLFTYLFLALSLYLIDDFDLKGRWKSLLFLTFICWIWVNSHGAFVLFFVLLIGYIICQGIENRFRSSRKRSIPWEKMKLPALALVLGFLLSFLNPYGTRLLLYPFKFIGPSIYRSHLVEWVPPDLLGEDFPFLIFIIFVYVLAAVSIRKLRPFDFFALFFFSYLAITTVRHITIFCFFCVPLLAVSLQSTYRRLENKGWWQHLRHACERIPASFLIAGKILLAVLFCLSSYLSLSAVDLDNLNMEKSHFPKYGVQFIRENRLPAPLFNPYEWGGYLMWTLFPDYRVFVDGRINNAYPEQTYKDSLTVMFGKPGWEEVLNRYNVNTVMCNKYFLARLKEHWLGDLLLESGRWKLIFEDRIEQIYVRESKENSKLIQKAAMGGLIIPESAYRIRERAMEYIRSGNYAPALEYLLRALKEDRTYSQLYVDLGYVYFMMGNHLEAKCILERGIRRDSRLFLAHDLLGVIYEKEGNIREAGREFQSALRINPEFEHSREELRKLEGKFSPAH